MRKFTLLIASLFITMGAMAQTPVLELTSDQIGATTDTPYQLTAEDAAKVFDCTDITVEVDVTIPTTFVKDGRYAIVSVVDPAQPAQTNFGSTKENTSFFALGCVGDNNNNANIATLVASQTGMHFSYKNGNAYSIPGSQQNVKLVYSIDATNNVLKLYVNGTLIKENSYPISGYELASFKKVKANYPNANIYVGGGIVNNENYAMFGGTVKSVRFYNGVYSALEIEKADALAIIDGIEGKVGYPVESVINTYKETINNATTVSEIETAKTNLCASTEVNLPEVGKAYTFTFIHKDGTEYYINCTGTSLEQVARTDKNLILPHTAVFRTYIDNNGEYYIKSYNDKFVGYHTVHDNAGTYTQASFVKILDGGDKVLVPNDDNEVLFGRLYLEIEDRTSSNTNNGVFISKKTSNGAMSLDNSSAPFYQNATDRTDGNNFSSVLKIEEVGKYYRLKNYQSAWYATSNMSSTYSGKLAMEENGETVVSIWYLTYDNKFLSYAKGLYLGDFAATNGDWSFEEVGSAGNNATFYSGNTAETYQIRPSSGRALYGDDERVDAAGSGNNTGNYNWIIEEVLSLPVTITDAKYATFYAPVAVELPEGLTAHTVTINGEWATLSESYKTVPANTGVILAGEAGDYDLTIINQAAAIESNFKGTVAATYVTEDAYVLGVVDGEVGLYKATTEGQAEGTFLNNGHKAYLPASAVPNKSAAFYGFDWEGTTGVEKVEIRNEKSEIYDLTGRRVENPSNGIYIVNGVKTLVK